MARNKKLKNFIINGLFGELTIDIPFSDEGIKILVGENGVGKTTILNIIYYSLSCNFRKLNKFNFDSLIMKFDDDEEIVIKKSMISQGTRKLNQLFLTDATNNQIAFLDEDELELRNIYLDKRGRIVNDDKSLQKGLKEIKKKIENNIQDHIIYFPTYRRIEEDLHKINPKIELNNKNLGDNILQFGMDDVERIFHSLMEDIRESSLNGYTKVTGNLIKNLINKEDKVFSREVINNIANIEVIDVILSRIDDNYLSKDDKQSIRNMISHGKIYSESIYNPLIYLLSDLVKTYKEQQEKTDQAVKKFVNVCNGYLINKKFYYDESGLKINIFNKKGEKVELSNLSSGEKQIVSIFSKIYLTNQDSLMILFDEPELSLSLEWQERLLVDILESGKCNFLLCVTHSPFIYNNRLKHYARGIDLYIKEV